MSKNSEKNFVIRHKNIDINVAVKKNRLSKNYKFTFDKKNLRGLVSIPTYITINSGVKFAKDNIDWLYRQLKALKPLIYIDNGVEIKISNKKYKIIYKKSNFSNVNIIKNKILILSKKNNHRTVLYQWLREELLKKSTNILSNLSSEIRPKSHMIKLTNSFNYWGSCNSKGEINLNWRLIFSPDEVVRYIIVHEVCHLIEFNHSDKFWKLIKKHCPNYTSQINWLKKNDNYLYSIRFS